MLLLPLLPQIGIAACDMAEVIGSAVAIRLLSAGSIPLWACVLITGVDVALVMIFELRSFRILVSVSKTRSVVRS
jgi:manganese transport protein